jgi:PBP1b-binding outer membrane lipoprotein LpoB
MKDLRASYVLAFWGGTEMKRFLTATLAATLLGGCVVHEHRTSIPGVTPVTKQEVLTMTSSGYTDEALLARIRQDGVERHPSAEDLVEMKNAGVSEAVMNEMLSAPVTVPRAPAETSTVEVVDYTPAVVVGFSIAAWLFGARHSHRHVHTVHCRH